MKMVLRSLELHHFKCFPALHIDFHESLTSIYGDNATGKTSVYDALTWLLFDKDSAGNARPDIKPHGMTAGVMPTVTAVLDVDGVTMTLRKSLREKWEKPRGSATARYAGDTRDYFVDDVPCKENEFKRQIAALIDEEKFRLLTDVWAVTTKMHWKERRDLLAEVCGLPDDAELLAGAPQFAELSAQLGRRTVNGYKAICNYCNLNEVPDNLAGTAALMVRGLINGVQLQNENMQPAAKGVSRGDTSFSFATAAEQLAALASSGDFLTDYKAQLNAYRKMR